MPTTRRRAAGRSRPGPTADQKTMTEFFNVTKKRCDPPLIKRPRVDDTLDPCASKNSAPLVTKQAAAGTPTLLSTSEANSPKRKGARAEALARLKSSEDVTKPTTPTSSRRKLTFSSGNALNNCDQDQASPSTLRAIRLPSKTETPLTVPNVTPCSNVSRSSPAMEQNDEPPKVIPTPEPPSVTAPAVLVPPPAPSKSLTRKKIGRVRNLVELRAQLAKSSEIAKRLNECRRDFDGAEADIRREHISPRKTPVKLSTPDDVSTTSPEKEPFVPAHARYAHLLADANVAHLALPDSHQLLHDLFRHTDVVAGMMMQRKQSITFEKLRPAVQALTRRDFKQRHLGQFKHVYPESYSYHVQKAQSKFGRKARDGEYDLVIVPQLDNDLLGQRLPISPGKSSPAKSATSTKSKHLLTPQKSPVKTRVFLHSPTKTPSKLRPPPSPFSPFKLGSQSKLDQNAKSDCTEESVVRLSGTRQLYRASIFRKRLVDSVMQAHDTFLSTLHPPVLLSEEERSRLRRWHPKFDLHLHVPDVPVAALPQAPNGPVKPTTVRYLMNEFDKKHVHLPKKVDDALQKLKAAEPESDSAAPDSLLPATSKPSLKGVSGSLLEKIRAKQALKEQQSMLRDDDAVKRQLRMSRLPDFIRIIRMTFMAESKASLPLENLTRKLLSSYSNLIAESDILAHIDLLIELLPNWLCRSDVRGHGVYVRLLNKSANVAELVNVVKTVAAKEKT